MQISFGIQIGSRSVKISRMHLTWQEPRVVTREWTVDDAPLLGNSKTTRAAFLEAIAVWFQSLMVENEDHTLYRHLVARVTTGAPVVQTRLKQKHSRINPFPVALSVLHPIKQSHTCGSVLVEWNGAIAAGSDPSLSTENTLIGVDLVEALERTFEKMQIPAKFVAHASNVMSAFFSAIFEFKVGRSIRNFCGSGQGSNILNDREGMYFGRSNSVLGHHASHTRSSDISTMRRHSSILSIPDVWGMIAIGDGLNACVYDPDVQSHFGYAGVVVDLECGYLNRCIPMTVPDSQVDFSNPLTQGHFMLEKMVAIPYLGEIVRLAVLSIYLTQAPKSAWRRWSLSGEDVLSIADRPTCDVSFVSKVISPVWGELPTPNKTVAPEEVIFVLCKLVVDRAAAIAAGLTVGILMSAGRLRRTTFWEPSSSAAIGFAVVGDFFRLSSFARDRYRQWISLTGNPDAHDALKDLASKKFGKNDFGSDCIVSRTESTQQRGEAAPYKLDNLYAKGESGYLKSERSEAFRSDAFRMDTFRMNTFRMDSLCREPISKAEGLRADSLRVDAGRIDPQPRGDMSVRPDPSTSFMGTTGSADVTMQRVASKSDFFVQDHLLKRRGIPSFSNLSTSVFTTPSTITPSTIPSSVPAPGDEKLNVAISPIYEDVELEPVDVNDGSDTLDFVHVKPDHDMRGLCVIAAMGDVSEEGEFGPRVLMKKLSPSNPSVAEATSYSAHK